MSKTMHPRQDPARCAMKPADWPDADRAAWQAAIAPGDRLDPGGGAALGRAYVRGRGPGLWALAHLARRQRPARARGRARGRAAPDLLARYIADLRTLNASSSVWMYVSSLCRALRVMAPAQDWRWLRDLTARLHWRAPSGIGCGRPPSFCCSGCR